MITLENILDELNYLADALIPSLSCQPYMRIEKIKDMIIKLDNYNNQCFKEFVESQEKKYSKLDNI